MGCASVAKDYPTCSTVMPTPQEPKVTFTNTTSVFLEKSGSHSDGCRFEDAIGPTTIHPIKVTRAKRDLQRVQYSANAVVWSFKKLIKYTRIWYNVLI